SASDITAAARQCARRSSNPRAKGEASPGWSVARGAVACLEASPVMRLGSFHLDQHTTPSGGMVRLAETGQLIVDERDRFIERRPARTDVTDRGILVADRHATEQDEPFRG